MQNSLEFALSALRHLPPHTSREILIIYAALTTCDPGEIEATIQVSLLKCYFLYLQTEMRVW